MNIKESIPSAVPEAYRFDGQFICGKWRTGGSATQMEDINPWTEEAIVRFAAADQQDVDDAYQAARKSQMGWSRMLPSQRAEVFSRAAHLLEVRKAEVVDWLVRESGSTIAKAGIEWWAVNNTLREAATLPFRVTGRIIDGDYPDKENRIYRKPVGVVGVISPWNWPLHLSMRTVAPALALGNAVVIKPAESTPVTGGLLIARLFEEAGLPPGVLNVLVGDSREIGDTFTQHPVPRVMSFTGSTAVGRRVGQCAVNSPLIKRAMLELGGNAPMIVTEDVDLDQAVHTALVGKFLHQGQVCVAINRIVVADAIHDAFVERFVAGARSLTHRDPADPSTAYGPIINRKQFNRLSQMIAEAKKEGARIRLEGAAAGLNLPAHVFDNVTSDMAIARNEIFGPVATILRARDDDDAVRIANDTEFGLTSSVLCRDEGRALRIARRIEAGMTHINDIGAIDMPQLPFGGEKNSGLGRFGSAGMIEEFTTEHWISVQHSPSQYPF